MNWSEHPVTDRAFVQGPDGKWYAWFNSHYPFVMVRPTHRQGEAQQAFDLRPDRQLGPPWQMEVYP